MSTVTIEQLHAWVAADEGEPAIGLTSFQHAAQAAELAMAAGADDELVVAAFLHDVGHAEGGHDHGRWARARLAGALSERVLWLIEHHITAKRYVCSTNPQYYERLSADSRRTLVLQGGPLSPAEAEAFAEHPWAADALRLRVWDDGAKQGGWLPQPLEVYLARVQRLLAQAQA